MWAALKRTKARMEVEVISTAQINNRGIGWANREIFRRLIKKIEADEYIADGTIKIGRIKGRTEKIRSVIDADAKIPPAIAAGIVAKVHRDRIMRQLHREFPRYGWKTNTGHGTKRHIEAMVKYGLTKYHRDVFVTTALRGAGE
jgi:ribonuclease HII